MPRTLGVEFSRFIDDKWIGFTTGINKAIEQGRTTAEDISHYAKAWWLAQPALYFWQFLILFLRLYIFYKTGTWIVIHPNTNLIPMPLIKDGYPLGSPFSKELKILGSLNEGNFELLNNNLKSQSAGTIMESVSLIEGSIVNS